MIGDLVRRDAILAGSDDVHRAVHRPGVKPADRIRELLLQLRKCEFPECATAADMVFPETRLAFVHSHAGRVAEERITVGGIEALIVEPVSPLVKGRENAG